MNIITDIKQQTTYNYWGNTKSYCPALYIGKERKMNYCEIKKTDIANGSGVRVTLFVSGCRHHCKGCFQPDTWNFDYGKPFTDTTADEIINALSKGYIKGLTLLGGEPMEPENQPELTKLLRRVKTELPEKDVWCYTGCTLETDLLAGSKSPYRTQYTDEMLSLIDYLVDGEFVLEKKNISLKFRGSENQRILCKKDGVWVNSEDI